VRKLVAWLLVAALLAGCAPARGTDASAEPDQVGSIAGPQPSSAEEDQTRFSELRHAESQVGKIRPNYASEPDIRIGSDSFAIVAPPPLKTSVQLLAEAQRHLELWFPHHLRLLDRMRQPGGAKEDDERQFQSEVKPGPYAEHLRSAFMRSDRYGAAQLEMREVKVERVYVKPWGTTLFIEATTAYVDRITLSDGRTTEVQHRPRLRLLWPNRTGFAVIDAYDAAAGRWLVGDAPQYSSFALQTEIPRHLARYLVEESYALGGVPHGPPLEQVHSTLDAGITPPFERFRMLAIADLDARYGSGAFVARRFEGIRARITRFEAASFLGDGVVTVRVDANVITTDSTGAEKATATTRVVRLLRSTTTHGWRYLPVDEQLDGGRWASGGDLQIASIDQRHI
jgi:hypothetical protein